jgi:hypothetical protein
MQPSLGLGPVSRHPVPRHRNRRSVGELVTESNWYGRILTAPFGHAVNKAITRARDGAERGTPRTPEAEETEE